jgi:hypothetical protein
MKQKITDLLITGLLITAVVIMSGCVEELKSGEPKIVIESYNMSIYDVGVDNIHFDRFDVVLRNEGNTKTEINKIVLLLGEDKVEKDSYWGIEPGEEKEISLIELGVFSTPLKKEIGIKEAKGKISVIDSSGKVLAEKNITIQIPIARIGDTIPEVGERRSKHNLSLTLLYWKESDIAVEGPYTDGYYTFTAKSGMKFIILTFKFQNNWIRVQETPYISAGEIGTDKGYIYTTWDSPVGVSSEEYKPRKSTDSEIKNLIGTSGGYEKLLPEGSIVGSVVFEIPENETPIEASIVYVPSLIKYGVDYSP